MGTIHQRALRILLFWSEVSVKEFRGRFVIRRRGVFGFVGALVAFVFGGFLFAVAKPVPEVSSIAFTAVAQGIAAMLVFLGLILLTLGCFRQFGRRVVFDSNLSVFRYGDRAYSYAEVEVSVRRTVLMDLEVASLVARFGGTSVTLVPGVSGDSIDTLYSLLESIQRLLRSRPPGLVLEQDHEEPESLLEHRVVSSILAGMGLLWAVFGFVFFPGVTHGRYGTEALLWPLGIAIPGLIGLAYSPAVGWFRSISGRYQTFLILAWLLSYILLMRR